jgi:acyl-CoA synthetase (AMP-forming)/AMP-acid ligase II
MIGALLAHPDFAARDLRCLRVLFYAGSSMPVELLRQALKALPHCAFIQCYGSTETGVVTVLGADDHRRAVTDDQHLLRSCGRPLAICNVQMTDAKGGSLGAGRVGEIEVASPNIMDRYWKDPEATAAAMTGRFVKSGDLGKRDEEGFVYIMDRKNDTVVTGGENVFPAEVEDALFSDPDILEAAVFGLPDAVWVEKVVAAVVLKKQSQVTGDVLISRLKAKLAGYKCPKEIFIRENLPKNAVGKILRKELRREYGSNG